MTFPIFDRGAPAGARPPGQQLLLTVPAQVDLFAVFCPRTCAPAGVRDRESCTLGGPAPGHPPSSRLLHLKLGWGMHLTAVSQPTWCVLVALRANVETARKPGGSTVSDQTPVSIRDRLGCTPGEACVALGIGRTLLYDLIKTGRLAVRKLGRRTVISVPSLIALMSDDPTDRPGRRGRPRNTRSNGAPPCLRP
jgi:hypothetical protein